MNNTRGKASITIGKPDQATRGRWQVGKVAYRGADEMPDNRANRRRLARANKAKARAITRAQGG